jgi:hypothetical protein
MKPRIPALYATRNFPLLLTSALPLVAPALASSALATTWTPGISAAGWLCFVIACFGGAGFLTAEVSTQPVGIPLDKGLTQARIGAGRRLLRGWLHPALMLLLTAVLNAADFRPEAYGAKTDDDQDDAVAIQKAIDAAIAAGPGNTVVLSKGRYRLHEPKDGRYLTVNQADHLTIRGVPGTILISEEIMDLISIKNSVGCALRSLAIDHVRLNFTQGTITAWDAAAKTVTMKIDRGYDAPDRPDLAKREELYLWPNPKVDRYDIPYEGRPKIIKRQKSGDDVWVLTLDKLPLKASKTDASAAEPLFIGEKTAIWGNGGAHGLGFSGNRDLELTDINYYGGGISTACFFWDNSGTISITRFRIGPPPGSNRLLTGFGGFMYTTNRAALVFDQCEVRQVDDDALDALTDGRRILKQIAPNRIQVETNPYQAGDTIEVWDWTEGKARIRDRAVIRSVGTVQGGKVELTLDDSVEAVHVGSGKDLHDGIDRIYDLDLAGPVTVRNSRFSSVRARPLLIKSGKSILVENCVIANAWGTALQLGMESYWGEGPGPSNITIRNNEFYGNNCSIAIGVFSSTSHRLGGNILIEGNRFHDDGPHIHYMGKETVNGVPMILRGVENVIVRNNEFTNNWNANIIIQHCDGVQVIGNVFRACNQMKPSQWFAPDLDALIWIDDSSHVEFSKNIVKERGPFAKSLVKLTDAVNTITGVDTGFTQVPTPAPKSSP